MPRLSTHRTITTSGEGGWGRVTKTAKNVAASPVADSHDVTILSGVQNEGWFVFGYGRELAFMVNYRRLIVKWVSIRGVIARTGTHMLSTELHNGPERIHIVDFELRVTWKRGDSISDWPGRQVQ
ncbi:hypothetical protein AG1IA_08574 [Rhizoctonia solani AG-1 IA]|uniref:Uncharacterized protein n=1 Tax=Thanatephorus cucumeris (strain AG1-IA) TaxID=983506 RepID=L8WHI6_THACA|nr:hypothetical protein AG1IA_08574 [Rhizoctonia solani AG-1 IA]